MGHVNILLTGVNILHYSRRDLKPVVFLVIYSFQFGLKNSTKSKSTMTDQQKYPIKEIIIEKSNKVTT